jgi:hypothetical protein
MVTGGDTSCGPPEVCASSGAPSSFVSRGSTIARTSVPIQCFFLIRALEDVDILVEGAPTRRTPASHRAHAPLAAVGI